MNYRNQCYMLLILLVMFYEARTLPTSDSPTEAATVNTPEETDKLPESNSEMIVTAATQETGNRTDQVASGATEAETDPTLTGDNEASASNNEPLSIYAGGLISPEAFQQYLAQYGGAAGLMPPGVTYPAPITGTPGIYPFPGPIMVQTDYEGFLVPANPTTANTADSTTVATTSQPVVPPSMNPLMVFASRLLPTILMSTVFRIAAVVISAVGVILFGGAITNALCRLTPVCDISGKAVSYLRSGGAQDVGRMLAEGITPERVKRTAEFVRNAIHKYRQLQKIIEPNL